jgi:hypothetical protein
MVVDLWSRRQIIMCACYSFDSVHQVLCASIGGLLVFPFGELSCFFFSNCGDLSLHVLGICIAEHEPI